LISVSLLHGWSERLQVLSELSIGVLEFFASAFAMPKNRIAARDAKHSKLPLPRLCITADRRAQLSELIDVSADLPVTDSAGLCELRDCCAAEEQGFCCAELLDFGGERELCVGHLSFQNRISVSFYLIGPPRSAHRSARALACSNRNPPR
jgi:hypothetical protein